MSLTIRRNTLPLFLLIPLLLLGVLAACTPQPDVTATAPSPTSAPTHSDDACPTCSEAKDAARRAAEERGATRAAEAQTPNLATATPRPPITVTILHTNDTNGYVDPCG
ncbi:MAG: hypothetical protein ACYC4R_14260 [Anaerolineae bacterium]